MADLDDIKDGKDFRTDQPQQNIPFTLKGCGALDWGMQSRLSRIFNPKTGKTVMLAFDHGYFQGPTTGLERIDINIAPLFEHADVLMCTRGILRSVVPPATNKPLKWGRRLSKLIMSKKVLNGLLPDVRYPLLLLAVKNYRSARRLKCAGRLSIRALLVWIWGVIFSSLTIRWR